MLSATNSVTDVKARLGNTYSDYGFADETAYTAAVTVALDNSQLLRLYPVIGSSTYTVIAAKDKVSLSEKETYLYWSEVYYACTEFLKGRGSAVASISTSADSEKLKVEGYEYESTASSSSGGSSNQDLAIKEFYDKAVNYIILAGWNPHNLQRGGAMFAGSEESLLYDEIV